MIINKSHVISTKAPAPIPLKTTNKKRFLWGLFTARSVNPYFSRPYSDSHLNDTYMCLKLSDREVVYRPNHSLSHGLGQAYLAVKLALMFKYAKEEQLSPKAKELCCWIKKRFKNDPKFLQKVLFTNAFQRTGRQSELSRAENKVVYEEYLTADQKNFETEVRKLEKLSIEELEELDLRDGKLFKDEKEIGIYKEALIRKFDEKSEAKEAGFDEDVFFLSKLFYTAHLLDLRRIPHFSKEKILKNVSKQLFGAELPNSVENQMLLKGWESSGDYLEARGDRDMEDPSRQDWDKSVFYAQAENPELLVEALELAMTKPEEKLLSSLLAHVQMLRELKTTIKKYDSEETVSGAQTEHQTKIENFRKNLKDAPYTASEAYLKIILSGKDGGPTYVEIPSNCSEKKARKITYQNICSFLSKEQAADKEYVNILVEAMMEERRRRDKVVLYHTTEGELGIIYDIYSQLRNQLAMQGSLEAITILRVIDEAFEEFNKSMSPQKEKASASDFAERFKSIDDTDSTYQAMGLSTNFGLPGCAERENSNTYSMFYNVTEDRVTLHPPLYDKFIAYIEQRTGIFEIYPLFKEILDKFVAHPDIQPKRNRRLIQIFIDPEVFEEVTYFSVIFGYQVIKRGKAEPLQNVIELLRNHPEKLEEHLSTLSAEKHPRLKLSDLQARLFMRPDLMLNVSLKPDLTLKGSPKIEIKSYWRLLLKNKEAYHPKIRAGVDERLLSWLKNGCPVESGVFLQETFKLSGLMDRVYHGSTTSQPPKARLFSVEERFVKLLISNKAKHAAILLEEDYEELKDKIFISPGDQAGIGKGQFDLAGLIMGNKPSIEVIEVALKKNVFKGGSSVYEFLCKLKGKVSIRDSLSIFDTFSNSSETARLFIKYFDIPAATNFSYCIPGILKGINYIENNEECLKAFLPFFENCGYIWAERLCEYFSRVPSCYKDLNLFNDALTIFASHYSADQQRDFCNNISEILKKIHFYRRNFLSQDCDWLFSAASKLMSLGSYGMLSPAQLDKKFKFIDTLSKLKWIPDMYVSAPFDAESVLECAKTDPTAFNIAFLRSPLGTALISAVIEKLNARQVPNDEEIFGKDDGLFVGEGGYDRHSPGSDLNKRIIAFYVEGLKSLYGLGI